MINEATPTTEKAPEPSSVSEAISMYQRDQAAAAAKEAEADAAAAPAPGKTPESSPADEGADAGKKEPESKPKSESEAAPAAAQAEPAPAKSVLKLVDEKGNAVPFIFKADGKDITEADLQKVAEYAGYGYHASARLAEMNSQMAIINEVIRAQKEGRLIIKEEGATPSADEKPDAAGKAAKAEDEDVYADPRVKELEARLNKVEKDAQKTAGLVIKEKIEEGFKTLKNEINAKKTEFPAARDADVWKLLELQDEKTGKPVHNVESAMRAAHEQETSYLMTVPLPKARLDGIIADYVAQKAKDEEAPVGSPSGAGPGGIGKTAAAPVEKKPITGIEDAMERFREDTAKGAAPPKF